MKNNNLLGEHEDEIQKLTNQIDGLEGDIDELQEKLKQHQLEKMQLEQDLQSTKTQTAGRIQEYESKINELKVRTFIYNLQNISNKYQEEIHKLREAINQQEQEEDDYDSDGDSFDNDEFNDRTGAGQNFQSNLVSNNKGNKLEGSQKPQRSSKNSANLDKQESAQKGKLSDSESDGLFDRAEESHELL